MEAFLLVISGSLYMLTNLLVIWLLILEPSLQNLSRVAKAIEKNLKLHPVDYGSLPQNKENKKYIIKTRIQTMNKLLKILGFSALISFTFVLTISGLILFTSLLFNGFWIKSTVVGFIVFTFVVFLIYLIINIAKKHFEKE